MRTTKYTDESENKLKTNELKLKRTKCRWRGTKVKLELKQKGIQASEGNPPEVMRTGEGT